MTVAAHPKPPPGATVPIDPVELARAGMSPTERGRVFNLAELTAEERRAIEEALRLVEADEYPPSSRSAVAKHLRHEREAREALAQPKRPR